MDLLTRDSLYGGYVRVFFLGQIYMQVFRKDGILSLKLALKCLFKRPMIPEGRGWGEGLKGKGDRVNNIVVSLCSERWLLEVVG